MVIQDSSVPKYANIGHEQRVGWLGEQINALNYMAHSSKMPTAMDLFIEASMLDQAIMDAEGIRALTQVEMQEAFRKGITREYGDFYGITTATLLGFLKGFMVSEKRQKAVALLYKQEEERRAEEDRRFWMEYAKAKEQGLIDVPEFNFSADRDNSKREFSKEEAMEHKKKIEAQRNEIYKAYGVHRDGELPGDR